MNTYLWKVTLLYTLPKPPAPIEDCAVMAHYIVTATNNANPSITAEINSSSQFSIPHDINNLTPYENLIEKQVLSWIQSEPNLVTNIQANLDGQIESLINPPITPEITPLPWATE
jgi:hypothetical protein